MALYGIPKRRGREWLDGARVGLDALVFAVSSYIGGSHGVREIFDSLGTGFQPNTQVEFARYAPTYDTSLRLSRQRGSRADRAASGVRAARWPVRREIRDETLTEIASRVARRRSGDSSIKRLFQPCSLGGTGRRVSHAQGSYPIGYGQWCFNM